MTHWEVHQHEKNQHTTSTTAVVYKTEDDNGNV